MPEVISCPSCERKLQVPESLLGQDVQCPSCNATFVAAIGDKPAPAAPPPPQSYSSGYDADDRVERRPPPRDDYLDDDYDDLEDRRSRRRKRRDFAPHRGGMILVFGILSLVICPFFGPFAWIMGNGDMEEIRAGRMDPEGEGLTQAGRILGIIGTIIIIFWLGMFCLMFIGAAAGG